MQNDILADIAFASQYAKEKNGKRENWEDAVKRVVKMHKRKFEFHYPDLNSDIDYMFKFVKEKRVFASQRSMQFGGDPILLKNMRIYNCTFSFCDRTKFFAECFYLLLCGSGTGFSIRKQHVDKIDILIAPAKWESRESRYHLIPDTIEGWSNAVWILIESYVLSSYYDLWHDKEAEFDYSLIRPKGAPISSGGKSPGAEPLRVALEKIRNRLRKVTQTKTRKLTALDCFDIAMYLSEAVLSGGVRRSASIALFDKDDQSMMKCKHDDLWFKTDFQRAFANISAAIKLDGTETEAEVEQLINFARSFGEPGVTFFKSNQFGTNPCAEIGLMPLLIKDNVGEIVEDITLDMLENREAFERKGYMYETGWQACNLTEINMLENQTKEQFFEACKVAAMIGTLQASYTSVGYLDSSTHYILSNEALIGVSLTGMCSNSFAFNEDILREGARIVNHTNKSFSKKLKIKSASRTTCIKPSGNTSTIAGCSPGIHPYHSNKYIRRIRMNKQNVIWKELLKKVPFACEDDQFNAETGVVSFACSAPEGALTKENDSAIEHLKRVQLVYKNWVQVGSSETRVEGLTHSVSNTCTVKDHEWNDVSSFIWNNREELKAVALLGYTGDKVYKQAPYEKIDSDNEQFYNDLLKLDYSKVDLSIVGDGENPTLDPACSGGTCEI